MQVALCTDSFPPIVDGVNQVLLNYGKILTEHGDRATIITPYVPGMEKETYPFDVYSFRSYSLPFDYDYHWGLGRLDRAFMLRVAATPLDIIHSHSPFSAHLVARYIAKKRKIPFVASFHSKYRDDFQKALKSDVLAGEATKLIMRAYRAADEVWTVNEASVEVLRSYGFEGPVRVMPNGCDLPLTPRDPSVQAAIRSKYDLPDGWVLGYVGRLVTAKNPDLLIDAVRILRAEGRAISLLIVGDGAEQERLMRRVDALQLNPWIRFAGIVRDRELLCQIYQTADMLLLPSAYDTSSLVPREAAACGCPTLLIEGSCTAQGVIDGENGFLAAETPEAFAARIMQAMDAPNSLAKAAAGAQKTLYRSWETAVMEARERYAYLIEQKQRA